MEKLNPSFNCILTIRATIMNIEQTQIPIDHEITSEIFHKKNPLSDTAWWTGKPPIYNICPGVLPNGIITSLPALDLNNINREKILNYFDNTWTLTEVLFSSLKNEQAFYLPPCHLRHPLIFYYCHPTVFYVNKLRLINLIHDSLNSYYESLFEIGVDEMSWDDMSK